VVLLESSDNVGTTVPSARLPPQKPTVLSDRVLGLLCSPERSPGTLAWPTWRPRAR